MNSMTKYERLKMELKQGILAGDYPPGSAFPSQNQLMRQRKVSYSTVARVLKELQDEGYIWRKRGRGSFVNDGFSNQSQASEFTIKVVLLPWYERDDDDTNVNVLDMYKGLLERASELKIKTENVYFSDETEMDESFFGDNDFFFLFAEGGFYKTMREELKKRQIPFLCHGCLGDIALHINTISVNVREMAYQMTRQLIAAGHRKIMFCSSPCEGHWVEPKIAGYKRAMLEADIPSENMIQLTGVLQQEVDRELPHILKRTQATAVIGHNDLKSLRIIDSLKRAGVRVPDDIAVVGFDDIPNSAKGDIKLTTCQYPRLEIGRQAVDLMLHLSKYPNISPIEKTLMGDLIFRDSFQPKHNIGAKRNEK